MRSSGNVRSGASLAVCVVTFGLLAACGAGTGSDERAEPGLTAERAGYVAPPAAGSLVATEDGTHLYYETVGSGPRFVLVPLHFFLRDTFVARPELLEGRTFVFYDVRNRGRSEALEDLSSLSLHRDVVDLEIVRRHVGADRVSLIGFSYLGKMVAMYAMEHPERVDRIVQLGPVPRDPETTFPEHLSASDRLQSMGPEAVAELQQLQVEGVHRSDPQGFCRREWEVTRRALVGDPERAPELPDPCDLEREWPVNLQPHFQSMVVASLQILPSLEATAALEAPVLVVHGTRDRHAPYGAGRTWAYELPDARLLTVEGAAHCSWVDAPETVFPAIARFLDGQWPAGVEDVERPDPLVDPDDEA
jgi:pimeloyl-ACP methyl ester carboxylesterase